MSTIIAVPLNGRAEVLMPYRPNNRELLRNIIGPRKHLEWNRVKKRWEVSRSSVPILVEQWLPKPVRVFWEVRTGSDRCDMRCRAAVGHDCSCACGGVHHGSREIGSDWIVVGQNTIIREGDTHWLVREVAA